MFGDTFYADEETHVWLVMGVQSKYWRLAPGIQVAGLIKNDVLNDIGTGGKRFHKFVKESDIYTDSDKSTVVIGNENWTPRETQYLMLRCCLAIEPRF